MPDVVATTSAAVCELWLTRVHDALKACPTSAPIDSAFVAAGAIAWDSCCGFLVAAPERVYRSADFPIEGTTDYVCETSMIVVDIVVLLLRCVPVVDDRGVPPTPAALSVAYDAILTDAAVIWNTVVGELPEGWERSGVDQAFVGAEGGCVGIETRMTIGLSQDAWCPEC